ncbi:hypothetical protein TRVA0_001S06084 [Trichomonascus vanleenenianus]|uniref:cytochrome c lysine N-methyltransferase n=1 Tax=Trichomonascus vanleenenianus TaxID=2268995 RepID=UPI003EC9A5CF
MNDELKEWVERHPDIEFNCTAGPGQFGNGLIATEQTLNSDKVVHVPIDYVVTADLVLEYAQNHPLLQLMLSINDRGQTGNAIPSPRRLIFRFFLYQILLARRGDPDPRFGAWVTSLPPSKDIRLPFTWDAEEIDGQLRPTSIFEATMAKRHFIEQLYNGFFSNKQLRRELAKFIKKKHRSAEGVDLEITYAQWLLVEEWISSRAMSIPHPNDPTLLQPAMVPLIDFANHGGLKTNATYVANKDGSVDLVLLRDDSGKLVNDVKPGDEIFINYGPTTGAAEFLFNYGFVPLEYTTARQISYFYPIMSDDVRKCIDSGYEPPEREEDRKGNLELPTEEGPILIEDNYELLCAYYESTQSRIEFLQPPEGKALWSDDFLVLCSTGEDLILRIDKEEQQFALFFRGEILDSSDITGGISSGDPEFYEKVVRPRGNTAVVSMIRQMFLPSLLGPEDFERQREEDRALGRPDRFDKELENTEIEVGLRLGILERKLLEAVIDECKKNLKFN